MKEENRMKWIGQTVGILIAICIFGAMFVPLSDYSLDIPVR